MPVLIRIDVSDPDLRAYVADCLHSMPDVRLAFDDDVTADADLVVTDSAAEQPAGTMVLFLADEPDAGSINSLVMPFDALALRAAVRRALPRLR